MVTIWIAQSQIAHLSHHRCLSLQSRSESTASTADLRAPHPSLAPGHLRRPTTIPTISNVSSRAPRLWSTPDAQAERPPPTSSISWSPTNVTPCLWRWSRTARPATRLGTAWSPWSTVSEGGDDHVLFIICFLSRQYLNKTFDQMLNTFKSDWGTNIYGLTDTSHCPRSSGAPPQYPGHW